MKTLTLALAAAFALAATGETHAQAYPAKPVRILVTFSAGSQADVLARLVGAKLSDNSGQQVVVDNRPSAGGIVAGGIMMNATPDGYTLIMHSNAFAVSAALYTKLPYDSLKDFAPVGQVASVPYVLVVAPGLGVKSVRELGVSTAQRTPVLPDVPTIAEAGLAGYEVDAWFGIFAPGRTPHAVVSQINAAISRIVHVPELKDRMRVQGVVLKSSTPEEFAKLMADDVATLGKIVKAAGIKVD